MSRLREFAAAAGFAALCAASARAADVPQLPPPPIGAPIEKRPVYREDFSTGWYLRGDLGYAWPNISSATASTGSGLNASTLGKQYDVGFGVGIKSRWFRSDVTIDYASPFNYTGSLATSGDTTAKIQATSVLLNAYADLGTWYRLTPYIGVGVGAANVRLTSVSQPGFTGPTSANRWNLAWAAMAGVGWTVAPNLVIDFGYRFRSVGDAKSAGDAVGNLTFKNITANEVRVGLRWSFDDLYSDR
ncbi:MAG TPA: outer membrane protein [Pseudolabrys sp.]|nr:outer membrane protein [Pseudolabrys sp.]